MNITILLVPSFESYCQILIVLFYRQFRLCITALLATRASGKAHTPKVVQTLQ